MRPSRLSGEISEQEKNKEVSDSNKTILSVNKLTLFKKGSPAV